MEQVESVPFSALIAGLLLYRKEVNSVSIVNAISALNDWGISIDDENDTIDDIDLCVEMGENYNFHLKMGLDYGFILYGDVSVFQFLLKHTDMRIISCFDTYFMNNLFDRCQKEQQATMDIALAEPFENKQNKTVSISKRKVLKKPTRAFERVIQRMAVSSIW